MSKGVIGLVEGTNTMFLIDKQAIPVDRWKDVIYGRVVVYYRLDKSDPYCTRLTVGGDRLNYPGDCITPEVSLTTVNLLLNSIVLTLNANFMTINIKDFYLNTPMVRSDYMLIKKVNLPNSVVIQYNIEAKATRDGYVHLDIRQGMYGLPQAGLISQKLLQKG